ncbi:DUF4391 domain-containing protein [Mesorhizobium sp. M0496]|uniref:DUF4391 domain-containing protein n=1 Tax=Mesorhizobium sp. M0496 TaxID=2956952 RepID=UPI00333A89E5
MTTEAGILAVVEALGLPPEARVDARVPKKLLVEQGAPTASDKRAIQDGIDELQWLAACKPTTIGVPSFADDTREYLEIAVAACAFRPDAKAARLIELIHRAIPYPVVLVTSDEQGVALSVAHKRHAQNEAGKVVIERVVSIAGISKEQLNPNEQAFLESLPLAKQSRRNLWTLYEGWLVRIEALSAARLSGAFAASDDAVTIERRREALEAQSRLMREIIGLRAKATREKQLNRRVDLNLEIQRLEAEIAAHQKKL